MGVSKNGVAQKLDGFCERENPTKIRMITRATPMTQAQYLTSAASSCWGDAWNPCSETIAFKPVKMNKERRTPLIDTRSLNKARILKSICNWQEHWKTSWLDLCIHHGFWRSSQANEHVCTASPSSESQIWTCILICILDVFGIHPLHVGPS